MTTATDTEHYAGRSLRNNFSWTLMGNAVYVLCQWGILTSLARLGSTHLVGQYAWSLAFTAPLFILSGLSLREVLVTDTANQFGFKDYLTVRGLANVASLAFLCILLGVIPMDRDTFLVTIIVACTKAVESVSDIIHGAYQKHEYMLPIAASLALRGVLNFSSFTLVLWLSGNLATAALATTVGSVATLLLLDTVQLKKLLKYRDAVEPNPLLRSGQLGRLWLLCRISLPLGIAASMISFNFNISRYFLGSFAGNASLGIYSVLSYPTLAGNLIIGALASTTLPRMSRLHASGDVEGLGRFLLKLLGIGLIVGTIATIIAWWSGKFILESMFGPEYAAQSFTFTLLMAGTGLGFLNYFLNSAMSATRQFHSALAIQALLIAVTALLCWILIPSYGLVGAAWVSILVMAIGGVFKAVLLLRPYHMDVRTVAEIAK